MVRKLAIILAVLLVVFGAFALVSSSNVSITINGRELSGPLEKLVGIWGIVLAGIVLFCVAILLAFVLAGVGLLILGCLVLVGSILTAVAFPFLLPILIPLFVVWLFCWLLRRSKTDGPAADKK
jgi:hypothetical protein